MTTLNKPTSQMIRKRNYINKMIDSIIGDNNGEENLSKLISKDEYAFIVKCKNRIECNYISDESLEDMKLRITNIALNLVCRQF